MVNLIPDKDIIYKDYTDVLYSKFKELRFGVSCCAIEGDIRMLSMKKRLVEWQEAIGIENAPLTNIRIITNLPLSAYRDPGSCNTSVQVDYTNIDDSMIEVQTDGCITRINVANPAIGVGYTFIQNTPSAVWTINHQLNYKPNVNIEDTNGNTIIGDINHINTNNLTITFSTAVTGKAYLS